MCSTLQSDIEAFKAANLNACFEDFIRWYSPNDWEEYIDDENTKQHKLSGRMSAEGNTWQMMWQQAKAVPVSRQKRLFDDTIEGFRVLSYLETRNLGEIFDLTIVPLLHSAVLKLMNIFENTYVLDLFSDLLEETIADLSRYSRDIEIKISPYSSTSTEPLGETNFVLKLGCPLKIINKIEQLELQFYQFKCFEHNPALAGVNLQLIKNKFKDILKNKGVCTIFPKYFTEGDNFDDETTDEVEERLRASFKRDMEKRLISKEYVMRVGEGIIELPASQKDNANVKPIMPQFLRAIVTDGKLRLCGAFTENTTFLN